MQYSNKYIFLFTAGICVVCSMMISLAAVGLRPYQERNRALEKQRNVLQASGLAKAGERLTAEVIEEKFQDVKSVYLDLASGKLVPEAEVQAGVMVDAPENSARINEIAKHIELFQIIKDGKVDSLVLPISGYGLWSTLYGFLALDADGTTVRGITYYQHGETPGLGGEVDNPKWKGLWPGRKAFGEDGNPALALVKGVAGKAADDPHHVDGLSGATLTSRGVTNMLKFWLGDDGYGPYLKSFREKGSA